MNAYHFNQHGVCINADKIAVVPMDKSRNHAEVSLAMTDSGKWVYGYNYWCYNGGGGTGASITVNKSKQFTSRTGALLAGIDYIHNCLQPDSIRTDNEGAVTRAFINKLMSYRGNHCQLTLF